MLNVFSPRQNTADREIRDELTGILSPSVSIPDWGRTAAVETAVVAVGIAVAVGIVAVVAAVVAATVAVAERA